MEQTVNLPAYAFEGSNPSLSTINLRRGKNSQAGIAHLVEHQPSKLRVAGSSPVPRSISDSVARESLGLTEQVFLIRSPM